MSTRKAFANAIVSLLLLPAVATAQDAPPAAPPSATPPVKVADTVDQEAAPAVPAPAKTLNSWREALALASAEDPQYSISLLEVERARGFERQAWAGTLPTLDATGVVTFNLIRADVQSIDLATGQPTTVTVPDSPTASFSLSLRQPLLAPRVWWAIGTAEAQTELAKMQTGDSKRTLVAAVADSIVTVVTAERVAEVNRVGHKAALDRLQLAKKRKELGAGSDLDIVRYRQDVVAAKSAIVQGDEGLQQARERLGLALGSPVGYGVRSDISISDIQGTLDKICNKGDAADRSDILALKKQREIAERAVTDADLMYAPTADLLSTFTYSSQQIIGDGHASWNIQGVLSVPIWDGGYKYGARRSAVASVKQQDERIDSALRGAKTEISQADRGVMVAQKNLSIATDTRDLAKETDRLVQQAYADGGDVTSFDLVDAARRLREAELTLAVRELELVRARIAAMLAASNCKE